MSPIPNRISQLHWSSGRFVSHLVLRVGFGWQRRRPSIDKLPSGIVVLPLRTCPPLGWKPLWPPGYWQDFTIIFSSTTAFSACCFSEKLTPATQNWPNCIGASEKGPIGLRLPTPMALTRSLSVITRLHRGLPNASPFAVVMSLRFILLSRTLSSITRSITLLPGNREYVLMSQARTQLSSSVTVNASQASRSGWEYLTK